MLFRSGLTIGTITAPGFSCSVSAQVVTCNNNASFAAGTALNIVINVTVDSTATNDLVNRAKVGTSNTDPQNSTLPDATAASACLAQNIPANGCATDSVPLNADLQIGKQQRQGANAFATAMDSVPANQTVQFQIDVSNAGPSRVTAAQVQDNVPTHFTGVTWTCATLSGGASCGAASSGSGNTLLLTTGLMPSGSALRLTVNATAFYVSGADGVTNTAVVSAPSGITDSTPGNNSASVTTRVGSVHLSLTKTNNTGTVTAGNTTTYTIEVNNTGSLPADGARLHDPVAAGLSCTAPPSCVATGPATSCPPSLAAAQLQNDTAPQGVQIPTLGPGGRLVLTYTCDITATGL